MDTGARSGRKIHGRVCWPGPWRQQHLGDLSYGGAAPTGADVGRNHFTRRALDVRGFVASLLMGQQLCIN